MSLRFTWDAKKSAANERNHRVSFAEAATAFADPLSITVPDPEHSEGEERFLLLGLSHRGRLLVISHTERDDTIRLISARRANRREQTAYEEA